MAGVVESQSLQGRKILVVGCSGQIGRGVLKTLNKTGIEPLGIDLVPPPKSLNVVFEKFDIARTNIDHRLPDEFTNAETLIHLASVINASTNVTRDAIPSIELNVVGTIRLLSILPNLRHVAYASSYMVYGNALRNPVDESHPTEPGNIYGASKLSAEKYLEIWSRRFNTSVASLRLMGVYGPGTPPGAGRAIPTFVDQFCSGKQPIIYGTGASRRNHVYIDDAADAVILAASQWISGVYNIGGSDTPSVRDIFDELVKISGKQIKPVFKSIQSREADFIADTSKAEKELGFSPRTRFSEGLKKEYESVARQTEART